MKTHISAGGVLYDSTIKKIYLIHKTIRNEWLLPKGHLESGETPAQAALRELKEETGYPNIKQILADDLIEKIEFIFKGPDGEDEFKEVYFFLAELINDEFSETKERDAEGLTGDWLEIDSAIEKVAHEDTKEVIRKAKDKLSW